MTPDEEQALQQKRPWMYVGYPGLSRWMASSKELVVLRRFDKAHARVLLRMQDVIVRLETELDEIDQRLQGSDPSMMHTNGSFRTDELLGIRGGPNSEFYQRCQILERLQVHLKEYDEMILRYRALRSDPEPEQAKIDTVRSFFSIRHYKENNKPDAGPLSDVETQFVHKDGDLLVLVPQPKAPLRRLCERWTPFLLARWFREKPKGSEHYEDAFKSTRYASETKLDRFINLLTLTLGLALLIVPLQLLDRLDTLKQRLNVICGLIALFEIVLTLVMPAKPWETVAATAAYTAVLLVFLQIYHEPGTTST